MYDYDFDSCICSDMERYAIVSFTDWKDNKERKQFALVKFRNYQPSLDGLILIKPKVIASKGDEIVVFNGEKNKWEYSSFSTPYWRDFILRLFSKDESVNCFEDEESARLFFEVGD